jgi:hypothetical protein
MESRFFLNVIVAESSSIFKLFSSENESLLIGWNSFFVLDFSFNIFYWVSAFNFESDCFSSQGFDKDLHTSSKSQDQVESRFFLDVIVAESSSIFKLFTSENESLLIGWDSFFVLDFSFYVFNCISCIYFESDCFSSKSFDKDLHTSSKS